MTSLRNAGRQHYMYTVGVFAAVCVMSDLLISCVSQLAQAQQHSVSAGDLLFVVLSAIIFLAGFAHTRQKSAAAGKAKAISPRYVPRSPAGARAPTEGESFAGRTGWSLWGDARAVERARREGVELGASGCSALMLACVRSRDAATALKLFDRILERGPGRDYDPEAVVKPMRGRFFALIAGQLDDERLRKDGLKILSAFGAHGILPPHSLQNRLVSAWESKLPEQVLDHFRGLQGAQPPASSWERAERRQDFSMLSSAMCRCMMADVIGSTGEAGSSCHASADAATGHDDAAAGDVEEQTPVVEERGARAPTEGEDTAKKLLEGSNGMHTATERTPLRREASTFVPTPWEYPWQMQPDSSMLCDWAPYAPIQYEEHTTVLLRNLPGLFLREDLIKAMDARGFAGLYSFVYMPIDFQTEKSKGYGFVNFVSEVEAQRFMLAFDGFRDWSLPSSKVCSVDLARTQGLDANVRMYRNSAVMGAEVPERFRPVLFVGTQRVPFPEPTRELQQLGSQCEERTTVMLRNLPCPFLREDLIKAMDAKGFAGLYNFVYIPTDFQRELSKGYGFVNFVSAEEAQRFTLAFDDDDHDDDERTTEMCTYPPETQISLVIPSEAAAELPGVPQRRAS